MFGQAKRDFSDANLHETKDFESLALKMCHFLLDVHGRARIIASWLHLSFRSNFAIVVAVVRIELLE